LALDGHAHGRDVELTGIVIFENVKYCDHLNINPQKSYGHLAAIYYLKKQSLKRLLDFQYTGLKFSVRNNFKFY
jgi:hypothetical protein